MKHRSLIAFGVVSAAALWNFCTTGAAAAEETDRRLRFSLVVENQLAQTLHDQRVAIYMPVRETSTQKLTKLEVSAPHRVLYDSAGNTILELTFDDFPAYATHVVRITTTLRVSPEVRQQKFDAHEMFLREEVFIEVNDPAIRGLADQLKGSTTRDTARSIYDWERSNLQYSGFIADDLGARYAAKERRGDCTEYAYLAAALARANGIPARVLGGYVVATDAAPRTSDYHNWTEMYVEGAWRLVDAQKDRFFAHEDEYVAMRVASGNAANALGTNHRFAVFGRVQARME